MKEKILFLTAYVPNKAAAGEKNTMIMLNDLSSHYDIDLVYFKYRWESDYIPERDNVRVVMKIGNSLLAKLINICNYPIVYPTFSVRFNWFVLMRIRLLIKRNCYKAVILNHSNMFLYGKHIMGDIPKILFCHDVIAQRVMRSSSYMTQRICIFSEGLSLVQTNGHIFSFSPKDCDLIEKIYRRKANLCLDYIDEKILDKTPEEVEDYFVLFGDWRRRENLDGALWFINEVGPCLNSKVFIKVIGREFPRNLKNVSPHLNLEILGFVDDPYSILSRSKALLSPLFAGAGIKVKVIEALACGVPVIGTEIAFEGLPSQFSSFMLLANKPEEYVRHIEKIDVDVVRRIETKAAFIKTYQSETITSYINRLS